MRPEARQAARAKAIQEGKAKKTEAEAKKKQEKAKSATTAGRGQARGNVVGKQQAKGAPVKAPRSGKLI